MFHWISSWSFLGGGDVQALIDSIYFVPILSGLGAIQLAQEPDGILSLAGQQKLRKKREKARLARIAEAEAETHGGEVPEHERVHTEVAAEGTEAVETIEAIETATVARLSEQDALEATFAMRGVVAGYGDAEVLHGVDLHVERGKVTALLGANGAGKSTLVLGRSGHRRGVARRRVPRRQGDHARRGVPPCPRRHPARPRGPRHLPGPDRRGEPHRAPARRASCARTPSSASRSSSNDASRSPGCSRVASSRC